MDAEVQNAIDELRAEFEAKLAELSAKVPDATLREQTENLSMLSTGRPLSEV